MSQKEGRGNHSVIGGEGPPISTLLPAIMEVKHGDDQTVCASPNYPGAYVLLTAFTTLINNYDFR